MAKPGTENKLLCSCTYSTEQS